MAKGGKPGKPKPLSVAAAKRAVTKPRGSALSGLHMLPRVVREPLIYRDYYSKSYITRNAKFLKRKMTPAEIHFVKFLNSLNHGVLKGKFVTQHVVSGKWIVDFFFSEIRLAVEIDGDYHNIETQVTKDKIKDKDCERFDITLIRITNSEVFGDVDALTEKLRAGWRLALRRENRIIGTKP